MKRIMYGRKVSATPTIITEYMPQTSISRKLPGVHRRNADLGMFMWPNISGMDVLLRLLLSTSLSVGDDDSLLDTLSSWLEIRPTDVV